MAILESGNNDNYKAFDIGAIDHLFEFVLLHSATMDVYNLLQSAGDGTFSYAQLSDLDHSLGIRV